MRGARGQRRVPWWLAGPGLLWLLVFFGLPLLNQLNVSLMTGDPESGFTSTWAFSNYADAIRGYWPQIKRSVGYAGLATVIDLVIAFPLALFIAHHAGRWRGVMLALVVLPFFMSQVLRTVSWQLLLADEGVVVSTLRSLALVPEGGRVLATGPAVVAGLAYSYLPFMVLPIFVTLDRLDRRLVEAAGDLYASRLSALRRITLPLALPGIVAGCLLVLIPATGDVVNALLLGSAKQAMIGNVIQNNFVTLLDYPTAAALSFLLVGFVVFGLVVTSVVLGARSLREAAV